MKIFFPILLIIILCFTKQENIAGKYVGAHKSILLNKDFTFQFVTNTDMSSRWAKGKWESRNDTIYFTVIPIYDTIRIIGQKEKIYLSPDTEPNLYTNSEQITRSRGSQTQKLNKLFYKKNILYEIDSTGNLKTDKEKLDWYLGLYDPWYTKMNE